MDEYVDRETLLKDIEERYCLPCKEAGKGHNGCKCRACWVNDMCGEVIDAPAADVAPVVHGRWIEENGFQICSECGEEHAWDEYRAAYCDVCGAKMDGDAE